MRAGTAISWMHRDGLVLSAGAALRSFAYAFLAVLLPFYLDLLGLGPVQIGLVLTAAIVGNALLTVLVTLFADRIGRRRVLLGMALLMAGGGVLLQTQILPVILAAAFLGTISSTGQDRGAFHSLEQALLPQTTTPEHRTSAFALYSIAAAVAVAVGALFSGVTGVLQELAGIPQLAALRWTLAVYPALALTVGVLYVVVSPGVEVSRPVEGPRLFPPVKSWRIIGGLSCLFAFDSLGGGFVIKSFLSYWFYTVYGLSPGLLGTVFFVAGLLNSISFWLAVRIARRIGLVNTMVFTHIPANVSLMLIPLMPVAWAAFVLFFIRELLSQMDVPTRGSYMMAVVRPEERTAMAGVSMLSRQGAQAVSPTIAGYLLQGAFLAVPFLVGGGVKIAYDVALFIAFRKVKPPEETG